MSAAKDEEHKRAIINPSFFPLPSTSFASTARKYRISDRRRLRAMGGLRESARALLRFQQQDLLSELCPFGECARESA
ncbi:hypothetical protein L596_017469 [Steinernema carpocapsae]|uniref:Uncharacterized protein n=1 Tax=Steinernema carpocapsae TaxID=34508 RepID=A0A4U5N1Z9_STECR|nr:hypothetical protein L596_017469 [Steinernema carpocapsae]